MRLENAVQKLSLTTERVPLRAWVVPGGATQAESILFLIWVEVRFGDKVCGVKLSPTARASSSAAYSDCVSSHVSEQIYAASRLLRSATSCACLLSLFFWLSAEKVCLWAVPLFKGNEKKRKLKQPLYNLNFGLPLSGGTSLGRRLLLRQLNGLSTELIGLLVALH